DPIPFLIDTVFDKGKELETLSARLASLLEFGLELVAPCPLETLLHKGAQAARQIIGANYSGVGILGADGERVRCSRMAGVDPQLLSSLAEDSFENGVFRKVVSERKSCKISISRGERDLLGLPANHPPIHSLLCAPLAVKDAVYGWIYVADKLASA